MNWISRLTLVALAACFGINLLADTPLPDLAQLKLTAEGGDPVAQFEYGQRASSVQRDERFAWYMKSAEQGYAPAQDAVAAMLSEQYTPDSKKKKGFERESLRWASRAAYQGLASAQSRVSQAYAQGHIVAQDPLKAYTWAQIAVNSTGGNNGSIGGLMYRANRDSLITKTSSEIISQGQRHAAVFKPTSYARMNPIEADLIFSQLKLSAIYEIKEHKSAVINNVRFTVGETKTLEIDKLGTVLTCIGIAEKAARVTIGGTAYETTLALQR